MARLAIHLLGSFHVMLDGEPVTGFASDKVRALLAYLVAEPDRPCRREMLVGLLWPEYPERSARAALRNALANLRRAIGDHQAIPPFLHITRQTIHFSSQSDHWLDAAAFTGLLTTEEPTRERLEDAVALYKGAFLEGFTLADAAAFEEWLVLTREHYSRQVVNALHGIAAAYEQHGAYEQALSSARRLVELEPWQEEGHRRLMRLLTLSGRRSEALVQYRTCRRLLQEELGIEPSRETQTLYEAICSGELSGVAEEEPGQRGPRFSRPRAPVYNLPLHPTPFIGREDELAALEALLGDPAARLVTIVGPGGIGKTRLAVAAGTLAAEKQRAAQANQSTPQFPHGIVFVPLAALTSTETIASAMAEALQVRLEKGRDQLLDYLRQKQLFLILDNFEHLLAGVRLLADMMSVAPRLKILVTSRERLQLQGEHVFPIQGLAFPEQDPMPSSLVDTGVDAYVEAYPALKLFAGTAQRVHPQFVLDPGELAVLAQICRLVEGMPLALELAASWADALPLRDILAEIQHSLGFLRTEWRDIPRRQRSIRAAFRTSWLRLGQAEQSVFAQLSVFRGGFTRLAAEQVVLDGTRSTVSPRLLARLVGKSFIQYDQIKDRYQVHELLRQYGAEMLSQDPAKEAAAHDRHSRFFCDWLRAQEEDTSGHQQQSVLVAIEADIENVHAACIWAAKKGDVQRLYAAVNALGLFYFLGRGNFRAGQSIFRSLVETLTATERWSAADRDSTGLLIARMLGWQATFTNLVGDAQAAENLLDEGAATLDRYALDEAVTKHARAHFAWQHGYQLLYADPAASRHRFAESLELFREVGERWGIASALLGLGRALREVDALEEAEQVLTSSLALHKEMGDQHGESETLATLGGLSMIRARFEEAEETIQRSLSITPQTDFFGTAFGLGFLGTARMHAGRFAEAEDPLRDCVVIHRELGVRGLGLQWSFPLGRVYLHQGKYDAARTLAERMVAEAGSLDFARGITKGLAVLGEVALGMGAFAEADRYLTESAEATGPDTKDRCEQGQLVMLGLAARGLGRPVEAEQLMLSALRQVSSAQRFQVQMIALVGTSLLYADEGKAERAVELFSLASRYGFVANSIWFQDLVGGSITAAAAGLAPGVLRAARERGAARDLDAAIGELLADWGG